MEGGVQIPPCVAGMRLLRSVPTAWLVDMPPASQHGPWVDLPPASWRGWLDVLPASQHGRCVDMPPAPWHGPWVNVPPVSQHGPWQDGRATCILAWVGGCATCIPARSLGGWPPRAAQVAEPMRIHSQGCWSTGSAHPTCRPVRLHRALGSRRVPQSIKTMLGTHPRGPYQCKHLSSTLMSWIQPLQPAGWSRALAAPYSPANTQFSRVFFFQRKYRWDLQELMVPTALKGNQNPTHQLGLPLEWGRGGREHGRLRTAPSPPAERWQGMALSKYTPLKCAHFLKAIWNS